MGKVTNDKIKKVRENGYVESESNLRHDRNTKVNDIISRIDRILYFEDSNYG